MKTRKFTEEQIWAIREAVKLAGARMAQIARITGVHPSLISRICSREYYPDIWADAVRYWPPKGPSSMRCELQMSAKWPKKPKLRTTALDRDGRLWPQSSTASISWEDRHLIGNFFTGKHYQSRIPRPPRKTR